MNTVIRAGDLGQLRESLNKGYVFDNLELKKIMYSGHLPVIQTLYEHTVPLFIKGRKLTVKTWIEQNGAFHAAKANHKHILEWLHEHVRPLDPWAYYGAAVCGSLGLFKWLQAKGCRKDHNGIENTHICKNVVERGHLHILQWLRANNFAWCNSTWCYAARYGSISILEWLRQENCPTHEYAYMYAAWKGHKEVILWLREKGYPYSPETTRLYEGAIEEGHYELLSWLKEQNFAFNKEKCLVSAHYCRHPNKESIITWLNNN